MEQINKKAQTAVEYMLLFAAVVLVAIFALKKDGFLTKSIESSLNLSVEGLELMVNNINFAE